MENNQHDHNENKDTYSGDAPEPAETDLKKHIWLLILILSVVVIAAIVSHLF